MSAADDLGAPGVPGKVRIAPGANFPGQPIRQVTLDFLAEMAGIAGRELVVTTCTRHSKFTVSGNVSDHFDGHAADMGMVANGDSDDSPVGGRIMAACFIAGGMPRQQAIATARRGGLFTLEHDGLRIQCIWKTDEGGNHHNHVHAGARPG
jgi:sulfite reductase beta subunit-like hemoprotein